MKLFWLKEKPTLDVFYSIILGTIVALVIGAILIFIAGANPIIAYSSLFYGAFGGIKSVGEVLTKASPLMLTGLSVTIAFRSQFWNIGAEGQLTIGALFTTLIGLFFTDFPEPLLILIAILISFLAGGIFAAIAGLLKVKFRANEIIVTLMMNFIAILTVSHLVHRELRDPTAWLPVSPMITPSIRLPIILPGTRLHAGLIIGLICIFLIYVVIFKTTLGYKIRAVGLGFEAAYCSGISASKSIMIASFISGGLAGLAGMGEIAGIHYRLKEGISMGYGFSGILIALLGRLHPLGVFLASVLFSALVVGAESMQRTAGVPVFLTQAIQALIVLCVLGFEILFKRRSKI
ncbi:MAG: ABC transporter permease [Candidatus Bathyarchaeia archaeon]